MFFEKGRYEMNRRQLIAVVIGACLVPTGAVVTSGCGGDDGNPARGSISAPRKGGGKEEAPDAFGKGKGKGKATAGGNLGGKRGVVD
jgi:hypothetical protein